MNWFYPLHWRHSSRGEWHSTLIVFSEDSVTSDNCMLQSVCASPILCLTVILIEWAWCSRLTNMSGIAPPPVFWLIETLGMIKTKYYGNRQCSSKTSNITQSYLAICCNKLINSTLHNEDCHICSVQPGSGLLTTPYSITDITISLCHRLQGSSWNNMTAWQLFQLEWSLGCYVSTSPALW